MSDWNKDGGGPAMPETRWEDRLRQDIQWTGMSLRKYAAIHFCVPDSGVPELDAMIRTAKRDRLAMAAMAKMASFGVPVEEIAGVSYYIANAMMEAK